MERKIGSLVFFEDNALNGNQVEPSKVVWQGKNAVAENFCSFNTCKKPIVDDKGIMVYDKNTGLIAFFHEECFKLVKK